MRSKKENEIYASNLKEAYSTGVQFMVRSRFSPHIHGTQSAPLSAFLNRPYQVTEWNVKILPLPIAVWSAHIIVFNSLQLQWKILFL